MAWSAVDKNGEEAIYDDTPIRTKYDVWDCADYDDRIIVLPEGTIQRIIGKKMVWEDEPLNLTEFMEKLNETN